MEIATPPAVSRRTFNRASLATLLAAAAAASPDGAAFAEQAATATSSKRRDVIKQDLPRRARARTDPAGGDLSAGHRLASAPSRQWRDGLRDFRGHRLEGQRPPRADLQRRCRLVGASGRGAPGLAQCQFDRAGDVACDLHRSQGCCAGRTYETDVRNASMAANVVDVVGCRRSEPWSSTRTQSRSSADEHADRQGRDCRHRA